MSTRRAILLYALALSLTLLGFWADSDVPSPWLSVRIAEAIFTSIMLYGIVIGFHELAGWLYDIAGRRK